MRLDSEDAREVLADAGADGAAGTLPHWSRMYARIQRCSTGSTPQWSTILRRFDAEVLTPDAAATRSPSERILRATPKPDDTVIGSPTVGSTSQASPQAAVPAIR